MKWEIKFDSGWGSAPDPAGGAYDAPPDPLVGCEGIGAYGASIIVPSSLASVLPSHLYVRRAASADSSRTCSESRVFSLTILPERHVHVSKKSYIDFGDNFNFGELFFFGQFNCR